MKHVVAAAILLLALGGCNFLPPYPNVRTADSAEIDNTDVDNLHIFRPHAGVYRVDDQTVYQPIFGSTVSVVYLSPGAHEVNIDAYSLAHHQLVFPAQITVQGGHRYQVAPGDDETVDLWDEQTPRVLVQQWDYAEIAEADLVMDGQVDVDGDEPPIYEDVGNQGGRVSRDPGHPGSGGNHLEPQPGHSGGGNRPPPIPHTPRPSGGGGHSGGGGGHSGGGGGHSGGGGGHKK